MLDPWLSRDSDEKPSKVRKDIVPAPNFCAPTRRPILQMPTIQIDIRVENDLRRQIQELQAKLQQKSKPEAPTYRAPENKGRVPVAKPGDDV